MLSFEQLFAPLTQPISLLMLQPIHPRLISLSLPGPKIVRFALPSERTKALSDRSLNLLKGRKPISNSLTKENSSPFSRAISFLSFQSSHFIPLRLLLLRPTDNALSLPKRIIRVRARAFTQLELLELSSFAFALLQT